MEELRRVLEEELALKEKLLGVATSPKNPCKPNLHGDRKAQVFWDCALKEAYIWGEGRVYTFLGVSGLDEAMQMAKQMRGA